MPYHIKTPSYPAFRFEWHETNKTVYLVRLGAVPLHGEPIAVNIPTHGEAQNTVLIWLRGYREAKQELSNVRDQRISA